MDEIIAIAELLSNGGEAWVGPAVSLLQDFNTIWSFELMGIEMTDANLLMQSEFLDAIRTIENGILYGHWEDDSLEIILAGVEYFDKFPGYGDPSNEVGVIMAEIKESLQ